MERGFFHIILCLILSQFAFAQQYDESSFKYFTIKDGLSDNYITGIAQDSTGNIWIATEAGLNLYDGNAIQKIPSVLQGTRIPSNIRNLKSFRPNQLAVITNEGVILLDTKNYTSKKYLVSENTPFSVFQNKGWDALPLPGESLAVTTATGFYVFDSSHKLIFRHDAYTENDFDKRTIRYGREIFPLNDALYLVQIQEEGVAVFNNAKKEFIVKGKGDKKWDFFSLGFQSGMKAWITKFQLDPDRFLFIEIGIDSVFYYQHQSRKIIKSPLPFHPADELNWTSKITMVTDTSFVINGGNEGFWLLHFNPKSGSITGNKKKYLPGFKINCIFSDREKRLWIGTTEGLFQQKLFPSAIKTFSYTPEMLKDSVQKEISSVYRYKDRLYVGRFARQSGLMILDTATMLPLANLSFYGNNSQFNEVLSIQMYHNDTLWLGTFGGLIWLDTKTHHYGKVSLNQSSPLRLNVLSPIGKDGNAWLLRFGSDLASLYNPAKREIVNYSKESSPLLPLPHVNIAAGDAKIIADQLSGCQGHCHLQRSGSGG